MRKLQENLIEVVQDPYGNYAITQALETWENQRTQPIRDTLKTYFQQLTIQKYSSNVIEKCVERADSVTISEYFQIL